MNWLAYVLVVLSRVAMADDPCAFGHHTDSGNATVKQIPIKGRCDLQLSPLDGVVPNRKFVFKSDGMIQSSDEYAGDGKHAHLTTSTKTFFVFPRQGNPEAEILSDQSMQIKLPSGDKIIFSPGQQRTPTAQGTLPRISGSSRGLVVSEAGNIDPQNQGGVEIKPAPGSKSIVLEVGYKMGTTPANVNTPLQHSTFRDGSGHTCSVQNSVLFKETKVDGIFNVSDRELFDYLKLNCPRGFQVPSSDLASPQSQRNETRTGSSPAN